MDVVADLDEERWIALFRETLPPLYAFVSRRVRGDRALAEDVTQETWLRAVEAWRREGVAREPLAWLQAVARRLIANHARASGRAPVVEPGDLDLAGGEPERPWSAEENAELHAAMARLPEDEAELLESFHLDGASTRQLAERHGTTERAIEGRLHRARTRLRRLLERRLG
jgi:RNA polymerase sigma-70 factor (ECF subfamily)